MNQKAHFVTLASLCRFILLVAMLFATLPVSPLLHAQSPGFQVAKGFTAEIVVPKLKMPTAFAFGPEGRIYVTEKEGLVRVAQNGVLQKEPFIDLRAEVNPMGQRGLLTIALHPRFPATPYVYLGYVYDPPEAKTHDINGARGSRVLRISANVDNLSVHQPGSGVVILGNNSTFANIPNPDHSEREPFACDNGQGGFVNDCLPNDGQVHAVAALLFGRDGALYVANGDGLNYGVGSLRAQALDSLAGKILRIDPLTGAGYPNNPFYDGNPQSNRSKVYLYGMKHPYRFAIHPITGELFVGDVGNLKWEEITRAGAGANLGWPCFEGNNPNAFDPVCQPVLSGQQPVVQGFHVYPHEAGWGAVIGGDFYTGSAFPTWLRNAYFYGDFNKGVIQSVIFDRAGAPTFTDFASGIAGIVQISNGPDGALYVLSVTKGTLYRIRSGSDGATAPPAGNGTTTATTPVANGTTTPVATQPPPANKPLANPAPATTGAGAGKILREWWTGIGGKSIGDLTGNKHFADKPDGQEFLTTFDAPRQVGSDYGARIRGYLHPPVSGDYHFWIASDDNSQLWLSSDANPANKKQIAGVVEWTPAQQWDRFGSQQSQAIRLQAGQRYYIEVLHKQGDQKDNLSVAWQIPGHERQVIEGQYLSPPE